MTAGEERQREMSRQFGENVRRCRERKDISQADVAREMTARGWAWHQSTVYKIEHGERRTDAYEVHDLAQILGVSIDRLFQAGEEAARVALADRATAMLHQEWGGAADAVARLHGAADNAARTLASSRDSTYKKVREACADLEAELAASTLDAAIEAGRRRWEETRDGLR